MDGSRFDTLTRSLAAGTSRRTMLKGLIASVLGFAVVSRPSAAQICTDDTDCETGFKCCPAGFCLNSADTCCGGGYCPAGESCCGDTNCCPNDGYTCSGTSCCETCDRRPGQCGEVQVYCGDTPTLITCPVPQGSICCDGATFAGDCCSSDSCGDVPTGSCGEMICLDHHCTNSGGCAQDHECCDGVCCDDGQYCCGDMCQDEPCSVTGCKADKDCPNGCCCPSGECSAACCHKPESGKGEDDAPPVIDTLPNTGSGTTAHEDRAKAAALVAGAAALTGAAMVHRSTRSGSDRPA